MRARWCIGRMLCTSCEGTGAVKGAVPSLVAGLLGGGRMDVAHLMFGPRKHVGKETPHDLGGLIGIPRLDCDLDRDRIACRRMVDVRGWRGRLVLGQAILSVGAGAVARAV
jgi:hypothetical protein